jgi:hypothetical protein
MKSLKNKMNSLLKFFSIVCVLLISNTILASDGNNIKACVDAASNYADIKLDSFSASYEARRIAMSRVKWSNAECEVKLGYVHNLNIDGVQIIHSGYAGTAALNKSKELKNLHDNAIQNLRTKIAILEQNFKDVDKTLQNPKPDLEKITVETKEIIDRALNR